MAIGALKRLSEAGYQVPQDIAVIGYDNVDLCNYLSPGLTSVSQNISDLGRESVRSLSKVLNGERVDKVTYLEPELIIRDSSS